MANSYYFPHDFSAANDAKVLFLRQQLGMEGYGIFWFIVEQLALAGGTLPIKIIPVLAMQMQTQEVKVNAVIRGFDLFTISEDDFFSGRLNDHLMIIKKISDGAKAGAAKRWGKNAGGIAGGIAGANANKEINKEIKERESTAPHPLQNSNLFRQPNAPAWENVLMHFMGSGGTEEMAKSYFNDRESTEWFFKGSPITNWVSNANNFIQTWKNNEQKFNTNSGSGKQAKKTFGQAANEWINS